MIIKDKMKMVAYLEKTIIKPALDKVVDDTLVPRFRNEYGECSLENDLLRYARDQVGQHIKQNADYQGIRNLQIFVVKGYKEVVVTNSVKLRQRPYEIMMITYKDITIYVDIINELDCMVSKGTDARVTCALPFYFKFKKCSRGYDLVRERKTFFPLPLILKIKALRMPETYYHDN